MQPGAGSNNPLKRPRQNSASNSSSNHRNNSISESNATARHFTGHNELMNRWKALASDASPLSHSASTSTSRIPQSAGLTRTRPGLTRALTTSATSPIQTNNNNPPQQPLQPRPIETPTLPVSAPTTSMTFQPPTSSSGPVNRPATALASQAKGPAVSRGLPSPAPSDDNTSSPLVPSNPIPLQQSSRIVNPGETLLTRSPTTINYDLPIWQAPQAPPQRHGPSPLQQSGPAPVHQNAAPSLHQNAPPLPQNGPPPIQQSAPSPFHHQIPLPAHNRRVSVPATALQAPNQRVLPSNMTVATPRRTASVVVAPTPAQFQTQPRRNIPLSFNQQALDNSAAAFDRQIKETQPNSSSRFTEISRIYILRQAIMADDWFYLILHQLSCLRTIAPTTLPDNIKRLGDRPFHCLEFLLSKNSTLSQNFLLWSSQFPLAIMDFYSNDNLRDSYRRTAEHVQIFLGALGQQWDGVRQHCHSQGAPPLVQEMFAVLHLPSIVLQSILFKSIGRIVLGTAPDTEDVLNALDQLHALDRLWFQVAGRRAPQQINLAINAMIEAFRLGREFIGERRNGQIPPGMIYQIPLHLKNIINPLQCQMPLPPPLPQQGQHIASNTTTMRPPIVMQLQAPPVSGFIFPKKGDPSRSQPMHPDPNRSALHQARARSPALSNDVPQDSPGLYRYVEAFVMAPVRLEADKFCREIEFEVTRQLFDRLPKLVVDPITERRQRELTLKSISVRLRCVKNTQTPVEGQTEWFTRDGVWPENTYFSLNGQFLETRGKLHWGKCLPIDLTEFVKVGSNKIGVAINRAREDKSPYDFLLAVELVVTISHEQIFDRLHPHSRVDAMSSMQKSLVNDFDGDDDVAVVSSVLTIDILDPISGSGICKTPVRGKECKHRNCFDLEIFLGCVKREAPGAPSAVDVWKCPICRGDVRPTMMIKDEFLMEVREELVKKGLADKTRSIVVESDGTWKAKEESKKGVRSPSLDREEKSKSTPAKQIDIVELD